MRLKVLTTALIVFSLGMMLTYPFIIGSRPHHRQELHDWLVRYAIYLIAILAGLIGSGICSVLLLRRAREEYRQEKEELMRQLLEATLQDQAKKRTEGSE